MTAYVALGANLGDPLTQLRWAKAELAERYTLSAASGLYQTAPVGGPPGQPDYLNAAVQLELSPQTTPQTLLMDLQALEAAAGRERRERWAARTLDLDVLDVGGHVLDLLGLELPHPRMMTRPFVLRPLSDIAPQWTHPVTGEQVATRLKELDTTDVILTGLSW